MASAVGEELALLEANELHLRFHGTHHDFKEHLAVLASQHLGLTFTPPSKNERDRKMVRRLKQKRLRSTPEWQAKRKTKRAEKRVQKLKSGGGRGEDGFFRGVPARRVPPARRGSCCPGIFRCARRRGPRRVG